jgi:hypothetical protein
MAFTIRLRGGGSLGPLGGDRFEDRRRALACEIGSLGRKAQVLVDRKEQTPELLDVAIPFPWIGGQLPEGGLTQTQHRVGLRLERGADAAQRSGRGRCRAREGETLEVSGSLGELEAGVEQAVLGPVLGGGSPLSGEPLSALDPSLSLGEVHLADGSVGRGL